MVHSQQGFSYMAGFHNWIPIIYDSPYDVPWLLGCQCHCWKCQLLSSCPLCWQDLISLRVTEKHVNVDRGREWHFVLCVCLLHRLVVTWEWRTVACGQTLNTVNIMKFTVLGHKAELRVLSLSWVNQYCRCKVWWSWEQLVLCRKGFSSSASFHCLPRNPVPRQKCLDFIYIELTCRQTKRDLRCMLSTF